MRNLSLKFVLNDDSQYLIEKTIRELAKEEFKLEDYNIEVLKRNHEERDDCLLFHARNIGRKMVEQYENKFKIKSNSNSILRQFEDIFLEVLYYESVDIAVCYLESVIYEGCHYDIKQEEKNA